MGLASDIYIYIHIHKYTLLFYMYVYIYIYIYLPVGPLEPMTPQSRHRPETFIFEPKP